MGGTGSLLSVPAGWTAEEEFTEMLFSTGALRVERILSKGHITPKGVWYDQGDDEWVTVLQGDATLGFDDGSVLSLSAGEHTLIPAHRRHRVQSTSSDPICIWLAIHGSLL